MKKYLLYVAALSITGGTLSALNLEWDGDTNSYMADASNWVDTATSLDPAAAPTSVDDLLIQADTNLRSTNRLADVLAVVPFASLTIDPAFSHDFAFRGQSVLDMYGDITFTSNFTNSGLDTFGSNTTNKLTVRSRGNHEILNDSAAQVSFRSGASTRPVQLVGVSGGNETIQLGGSGTGGFLFKDHVAIGGGTSLERLWTTEDFSATITMQGIADSNWIDPGIDFRIQGGTIEFLNDEQIGDAITVAFGGTTNTARVLDFSGVIEDAGVLADFTAVGTDTITVDGDTDLSFDDYRVGSTSVASINLAGWVEGSSSLTFTALGATHYSGTVANDEVFNGITLGGATAYMQDAGSGAYTLSTVPEPSTFAVLFGMTALGITMIRRRK